MAHSAHEANEKNDEMTADLDVALEENGEIKDDIDVALAEGRAAVGSLKMQDVHELRSYGKPPDALLHVCVTSLLALSMPAEQGWKDVQIGMQGNTMMFLNAVRALDPVSIDPVLFATLTERMEVLKDRYTIKQMYDTCKLGGVLTVWLNAVVLGVTTAATETTRQRNVILSAAYLMPVRGKAITAHSTRNRVLGLLEETRTRRGDDERSMIVDVTATTWNWDTYAIVGGKPSPVTVTFSDMDELRECLPLEEDSKTASAGKLLPQASGEKVWMPKGAVLRETRPQEGGKSQFIFDAPVDPNDDRLEHWEQEVVGQKHLHVWRAKLVYNSMRSMMRFYHLDRIVCWDLSWGIWEAVRDGAETCDDGFPKMKFVREGKEGMPFPSSVDGSTEAEEVVRDSIYECCRPVSPTALAETLVGASGYYLVGGNTYTMSLFHNMWDRQGLKNGEIGHMQRLRNQLKEGTLFYLGHSAGLIMSGPNILTATFKGIDAFSIVTQPYNAPFLRLPPFESPETFFAKETNDLLSARTRMLELMSRHGGWRGYRAVEAMAFPHYDARPRVASFPQSAETYLRGTNERGLFAQREASLLVGPREGQREEPVEVTKLREETNGASLPCYPIANGHAILMECGGMDVVEALSPVEEGAGILHWDTYMPYVLNENWVHYETGRDSFAAGSFTSDKNTMAGDRSSEYDGTRIFSRLEALGLPNPGGTDEGSPGLLFRTK